ncbi:hypothetical protein DICPUDRAFT_154656 [Dictyostelium purpureum]|uniref:EGF-like domain-containing protein n=1 Tax=Dictyostelium purpureum TaxID=5786 RepID=F0ZRX1_DICPU|nr:uncharacterized protein DICPUDRAFT_154656 [Dictyostelium purpureum]EGC33303.1 hypothetical protein DICPUDRAFT_154656 [Dictyostelium purpureum]|eukprot:XP_003290159.1 hypothetical protein DICPUDRAFT_154656 [Dictyostelium purpureum]
MKIINNLLLILLFLFLYSNNVKSINTVESFTIGTPYPNGQYVGVITPFSPGGLGNIGISFTFNAYEATLTQYITVNFYDQESNLKFSIENVYFALEGEQQTTNPSTSGTASAVDISILDQQSIKASNTFRGLKAAQNVYKMTVTFPASELVYPGSYEIVDYLTFGFDIPAFASYTFPDQKITFVSPAYHPNSTQILKQTNIELSIDYGESQYCKSIVLLDENSISHSYGLYYITDKYQSQSVKLNSIKTSATSDITKFYFLSKYPISTTPTTFSYTLFDAITGQTSLISATLTCNSNVDASLPSNMVVLGSSSFTYVAMKTSFRVATATLNSAPLKPTSIKLSSGKWIGFVRLSNVQLNSYSLNISPEGLTNVFTKTPISFTPNLNGVKVVQLSSFVENDVNLKKNVSNSQLKFYVEVKPDVNSYGKVATIDFQYNGVVFYSDKEIVDNIYKKVIYIPDTIITKTANILKINVNSENFGRYEISQFTIDMASLAATTTSNTISNQEMNLQYGKKFFLNSFKGRLLMSEDIYQIPNLKMSYYTTDKTTFFAGYNDDVYIESNYPFGYTNYFNNLTYEPSVPFMSDTPGSTINSDPNYAFPTSIINSPLLKRDYVNPNVFSAFTFSSDLTQKPDSVVITVSDSIGISSIKPNCKVSLGPTTFTLLPSNIFSISEPNFSNVQYQFNFKFNRYFCNSPPIIDCTDIRGNRLYDSGESSLINSFLYSGLESCTNTNIPPLRLLALTYSYNNAYSNINLNTWFVSDNSADYSQYLFEILVYDNYDNIGEPIQIKRFAQIITYPETSSFVCGFSISETILDNDQTLKRFISIRVSSLSSPNSKYVLSTKELEYMNTNAQSSTVTTSIISSQYTIRNNKYYDENSPNAIDFFSSVYSLVLTKDQITFTSSLMDLFKNITFVIKNKYNPYALYVHYDSTDPKTYLSKTSSTLVLSLPSTLVDVNKLFIDSICDHFSNCYELGPYSKFSTIFNGVPLTPHSGSATIGKPTFSRNYIDVSSSNRKVKVSIDISYQSLPFKQSIVASDPIFYITEIDSNDQVSCPLKQFENSTTFSCNLEIPFMFGSRTPLGHCSVYNLVYEDGYLDGVRFDTCSLFLYTQYLKEPVITEVSTKMYDSNLYFYGINLNLLDSAIQDKSLFTSAPFTYVNETSGYYILKEKLTKPVDIKVGSKVYSVFIYTCLKDDCSGNGKCNMTTLTCQCSQGWGGTDCSIDQTFVCKDNCNGQGSCSTDKTCNCKPGFTGVACEFKNSNISMNMNTSITSPSVILDGFDSFNLNNYTKKSKYHIELVYIQEVDVLGKVLNRFNFNETGWSLASTNGETSSTFNTTLLEYSNFTVRVDIFKTDTQMTWANEHLAIPANSIKFSVRIDNYTFSSNLNKLEMFYQTSPNSDLECAIKQQIAWGAKKSTDMHWVTLPNNQLQLYGRFSNSLILDDRIVSTSNEGLEFGSTVQVKVNIPFFKDYAELDPDFSVLVDVNMDETVYDECGIPVGTKSNRKWVIPVAVVVGVVGATILFISIFAVAYKKNTNLRLFMLSFKSKFGGSRGGVSMKNFN